MQHAERIHRQQGDAPLGLIVERAGEVGRNRRDVDFAGYQLGCDLIGGRGEGEGVIVQRLALGVLVHQRGNADAGGAFDYRDVDVRRLNLIAAGHDAHNQRKRRQGGNYAYYCFHYIIYPFRAGFVRLRI